MEILLTVLSFIVVALLAGLVKSRRVFQVASVGAGLVSLVSAAWVAYRVGTDGTYTPFSFLSVDSLSALIMLVVATVTFTTIIYAIPYFQKELEKKIIGPSRERQYYVLVSLFLATIFMTIATSQPVLAWIFLEATTLTSVFLVSFYGRASTIEAAWKYMIINAVGLLLAFFGTLLYFTAFGHGAATGLISWDTLVSQAKHLDPALAQMAFVFVLIGYGTKVGLAPMHTWKPDAYSKAPAPLGALFSGALMPVAFLVLLKFKTVTDAAVGPAFSQHLLIAFGLLSVLVAAWSILTIKNYKRMLAFSSIEHAGLISLGLGFGGIGAFAAFLQLIYHSFVKASLFQLAGNIMLKYHSSHIADVRAVLTIIPATGVLFFIGMFAVTGFPPFGIFLSEFFTLSAGIKSYLAVAVVALLAMVVVFVGFFRQTNTMMFGKKPELKTGEGNLWLLVPPAALLLLTLIITFYNPPFIEALIRNAVTELGV